jgi:hypothetical protein
MSAHEASGGWWLVSDNGNEPLGVVRRTREVLVNLEAARQRLSRYVAKGDLWALEEQRRIERRMRETASWLGSIDRGTEVVRGLGQVHNQRRRKRCSF